MHLGRSGVESNPFLLLRKPSRQSRQAVGRDSKAGRWWLEQTHDYIQWLFPLAESSRVVPGTPFLYSLTIKQFRSNQLLQDHLRASFVRMLTFLGLRFDGKVVGKAGNWSDRKGEWFSEPTHNLEVPHVYRIPTQLG